jgi:hypothetical protein
MAKKCWRVDYLNCADVSGTGFECEENVSVVASGNSCGPVALRATSGKFNDNNSTCKTLSISVVNCSNCSDCCSSSLDPAQPCDCLNGGCVAKTTYGTPGKYPSLAACESGCAKDSNCIGECVSVAEIASLQQAASNLRSRLCK